MSGFYTTDAIGETRMLKARLVVAMKTWDLQGVEDAMKQLCNVKMTVNILEETRVAATLQELRRTAPSEMQNVKLVIKSLINNWKALYSPDAIKAAKETAASLNATSAPSRHKALSNTGATDPSASVLQSMTDSPAVETSVDPVAPSPHSPAPTHEPSPYSLDRRWAGVDGCVAPDGHWRPWVQPVVLLDTHASGDVSNPSMVGPYALPL
eukprot:m.531681 g.531681  ORF g.531681 m.531681 type:complete len:210 (-) comp22039_c0_seq5:1741-2370(-)